MRKNLLLITFISISVLLIFFNTFIKGIYPFPGDFMLAWFEPWKSESFLNGAITIPHKPIGDDIFRQIYPFKILAIEIFKKFQLPIWNPYNGAGMPLLATMHTGLLNPFNILFFIFPNYLAWTIFLIIQPLFIGIFTYLYCQKLKLNHISSLFASLSFVFSGFVIVRIIYGDYDYAILTLPLFLYLIESNLPNFSSKKILFIPFIVFLLFTSVQPQIIFYILTFILFYFIYRLKQLKLFQLKSFISFLSLILIGIGLSAIQLIPTIELFRNASINSFSSRFIFDRFLLPIQHLITIFIPNYFGNQATYNYWGKSDYIETITYLGIIPCFFAYIGIIIKKTKSINVINFFFIATIITILLTLDWFGTRLLFSFPIPILGTSIPSRIFFLTTFSLCILAAFGFEKLKSEITLSRSLIYKLSPFVLFVLLLFIVTLVTFKTNLDCHNEFIKNCRIIALRNTLVEIAVSGIGGFLIILLFIFRQNKLRNLLLFFIILLVIGIGLYNSNKYLPFSTKETFLPTNNLISNIQNKIGYERIFGIGSANIKTNFATYFHFYDPNYYDPLYNKRYGELVSYANTGKFIEVLPRSDVEINSEINLTLDKLFRRNRLLDILGTKYQIYKKSELKKEKNIENIIWQDDKWLILENKNVLPRFYLVKNYEVIQDDKQLLKTLFDSSFNPKDTVLLEKKPNIINLKSIKKAGQKVKLLKYEENYLKIKVESSENALLVVSDNYYPGWQAYINEKETPIYRANYTFRAIDVPKGESTIEFRYEPYSIKIGIIISSTFLLLYILVTSKKIIAKSK